MAFTGGLGLQVNLEMVPVNRDMRTDCILFSESNARLLVEVPESKTVDFENTMRGSVCANIGSVISEKRLRVTMNSVKVLDLPLEVLIKAWKTPLEAQR
jgi:phosphoribosylformylglycinamidine synthase